MCTASWLLEEHGYQVFFNRDEQKGRIKAIPPARITNENNIDMLMPIDPQGLGTWLATNEYGLTLCLLNFYQGQPPAGELISRGQLVKTFAHYKSARTLIEHFKQRSLAHYAPFTLVIFDAELNANNGQVKALQWDGKTLVDFLPLPPLVSSAVDADNVISARRRLFSKYDLSANSSNERERTASQLEFHHSHHPSKGHLSPCMHRDDAHTVSFTHIIVSKQRVSMRYQEGAPCTQAPYQISQLDKPSESTYQKIST